MKIPDYVSINTTIIAVFFVIWLIKYPKDIKRTLFLEFKYPADVHASLIVWLLLTILLVGATYIAVAILYPN